MPARTRDWVTVGATVGGVIAWCGAVLPALVSGSGIPVPPVWWLLTIIQVACFVRVSSARGIAGSVDRAVALLMVVTTLAAVWTWGAAQVTPVLMVLVSGAIGWVVGVRMAAAVTALQTAFLCLTLLLQGDSAIWSLLYGALMFFAWLMVTVSVRETTARAQAAAAAAELERANVRLAEANAQLERANGRLSLANAELNEAQAALAEASRSEERLRISRDLHDGMGQQLTALGLHLQIVSRTLDATTDQAEHLAQARVLLAGVTRDMRGVVTQLRDGRSSVRDEIARLARSLPRPITSLDLDPALDEVPQSVAETLIRVVQEGLTNVARHTRADRAWVMVRSEGDQLVFEIRDNGALAGPVVPGNGLSGMAERISLLGGRLGWDQAPEGGLRLHGALPHGEVTRRAAQFV